MDQFPKPLQEPNLVKLGLFRIAIMHGESIDRRRFGSRKEIEAAVRERSIRNEWEFCTGGGTENAGVSVADEGVLAVKMRAKGQNHGWISQSHSHSHSHSRSHGDRQILQWIKLISGV